VRKSVSPVAAIVVVVLVVLVVVFLFVRAARQRAQVIVPGAGPVDASGRARLETRGGGRGPTQGTRQPGERPARGSRRAAPGG
jgi:flagellar biosynthesis/type III secretory pathway M-ring protein FliF/YscJ